MKLPLSKKSPKTTEPRHDGEEEPRADRREASIRMNERSIAHRVLVQPHVTEKAGRLGAINQYVFRVTPHATRQEIKRAILEVYGVRPVRVSTSRVPGKRRRLGRSEGNIAGYRKATVTLPQGKTIEILPK